MEQEIWKDVVGYEGLYQVSNIGNVKSLTRSAIEKTSNNGKRIMTYKLRFLQPQKDKNGYFTVSLSKRNKRLTLKVHRLVALAFIKRKEGNKEVNHKDSNKINNKVSNLEWCTHEENMQHAKELNLFKNRQGEENPSSKLTNKDIFELRKMNQDNIHYKVICKKFSISKSLFYLIKSRKSWAHI